MRWREEVKHKGLEQAIQRGYIYKAKYYAVGEEVDLAKLDNKEIVKFVANSEHGDDTCNNDDNKDDNCDKVQVSEPCQMSHVEAIVCADKLPKAFFLLFYTQCLTTH